MKTITDEDGVVRREKTKNYFWWCDLGPKGKGALRQSSMSSFLNTARVEGEGIATVEEKTLLETRTTLSEGQGSCADVAGIKRHVGGC